MLKGVTNLTSSLPSGRCHRLEPLSAFQGSNKSCAKKSAQHNERRRLAHRASRQGGRGGSGAAAAAAGEPPQVESSGRTEPGGSQSGPQPGMQLQMDALPELGRWTAALADEMFSGPDSMDLKFPDIGPMARPPQSTMRRFPAAGCGNPPNKPCVTCPACRRRSCQRSCETRCTT